MHLATSMAAVLKAIGFPECLGAKGLLGETNTPVTRLQSYRHGHEGLCF